MVDEQRPRPGAWSRRFSELEDEAEPTAEEGDDDGDRVALEAIVPGALYVVATPIGNLGDISARALHVLRSVDRIACEDTRVTRKLLARYELRTPLSAFFAHSPDRVKAEILADLEAGRSVALVSDAGTPLVSDPGGDLVAEAVAAGIRVIPIPGPSALTAALSAAGLTVSRFVFLGFLPRSEGEQRALLEPLRGLGLPLVLYESPRRVRGTLARLHEIFGDRRVAVAKELTKRFERIVRGALGEVSKEIEEAPRGEFVLVVEGRSDAGEDPDAADPVEIRRTAQAGIDRGASTRDVADELAVRHRLSKREAYRIVLALRGEG